MKILTIIFALISLFIITVTFANDELCSDYCQVRYKSDLNYCYRYYVCDEYKWSNDNKNCTVLGSYETQEELWPCELMPK